MPVSRSFGTLHNMVPQCSKLPDDLVLWDMAVASGPAGPVLAGPVFEVGSKMLTDADRR